MTKFLANAHRATVRSFEQFGHIYFCIPVAYDHAHDLVGGAMVFCALLYTAAAWAAHASDN